MTDFCYYVETLDKGKTLAAAMKVKHGCECAVVESTRMPRVFFVIPSSNADKWKLKYEKVHCTNSAV